MQNTGNEDAADIRIGAINRMPGEKLGVMVRLPSQACANKFLSYLARAVIFSIRVFQLFNLFLVFLFIEESFFFFISIVLLCHFAFSPWFLFDRPCLLVDSVCHLQII